MSDLYLSKEIPLPVDVATAKLAWFGENGAGKTYGAMKLAELMWAAGIQFVALDPVGPWHGLRIGKDGDGLPIVIFGGLHGDIPIRPQDGPRIAEVIVHEGISAVIDVSQFETDYAKAQFASEFAERFYFLKKTHPSAVHLFLEEAQEFVPENPGGGPNSKDTLMANRFQRIWKIGRNYGIGGSLISQRPQEISKKALNLSGAVFVFRLTGPHERDYMGKWLAGYGDKPDLPSIATGRPYLWSPAWLKHSGFIQIEEKETHDVSATPKVGEIVKARTLTAVAVQALRESLADIEDVEDNDPKSLKARIRALESAKSEPSEAVIAREVEIAIAPIMERNAHLESVITELGQIGEPYAACWTYWSDDNEFEEDCFEDLSHEDQIRELQKHGNRHEQSIEVWRLLRRNNRLHGACAPFGMAESEYMEAIHDNADYRPGTHALRYRELLSTFKRAKERYEAGRGPRLHPTEKASLESGEWVDALPFTHRLNREVKL